MNTYLVDVGWRGDRHAIDRFVSLAEPHITNGVVQFQIDEGELGSDRLGIEFSYMQHRDAARLWSRLIDWLCDQKLCCDERREDLVEWPCVVEHESRRWLREISHVKVVLNAGAPVAAKAYLSVTPL
jgi:hypothetical protein